LLLKRKRQWIPAFAGMTSNGAGMTSSGAQMTSDGVETTT